MQIGNHELNDNEAKWCREFAEEIGSFATKKAISALNKKVTQSEVQSLLKYLWSKDSVKESIKESIVADTDITEFDTQDDE